MVFNKISYKALLLVLVSTCSIGCAHRQPAQLSQLSINREPSANIDHKPAVTAPNPANKKAATSLTPFQVIVISLVSDSLDLLPNDINSKIFDVIQKGLKIPDHHDVIEKSVLSSPRTEDIAFVAGLIVQHVYGENLRTGATIPQVILYFHKDGIAYTDLTAVAAKVKSSENRTLDAYNACLNLLVNSLSGSYTTQQKPAEGLYVRDSKGDLYFHTKLKHAE